MAMMTAAVLHASGTPDVFRIEQVPVPKPGAGELLVRVVACGVSGRDVAERSGLYRRDVTFPLIIGLEIAGVVEAVGPHVRTLKIGDRVASKAFSSCGLCDLCRTGRETSCPSRRPVRGGYAQFTVLPEDALVAIPDRLSFQVACSIGPGAGVALNAVRDVTRVQMGETVLVTGASGGVGLPALQLARLAGARVIAVTRSVDKRVFLQGCGAHDVVVMDDEGRFARAVLDLTEGRGVDVVLDNVGSEVFWESFQSLAWHGRYGVIGEVVGKRSEINLARLFFKRAHLLGVGSTSRKQVADAARLAAEGKISPQVARCLRLEQVAEAHEIVEYGRATGRIVLLPNGEPELWTDVLPK